MFTWHAFYGFYIPVLDRYCERTEVENLRTAFDNRGVSLQVGMPVVYTKKGVPETGVVEELGPTTSWYTTATIGSRTTAGSPAPCISGMTVAASASWSTTRTNQGRHPRLPAPARGSLSPNTPELPLCQSLEHGGNPQHDQAVRPHQPEGPSSRHRRRPRSRGQEKHGIVLKAGNASFLATTATFKLECSTVSADGAVNTKEAEDFKHYAPMVGLKADDLGKMFRSNGKTFKITGYNVKTRSMPITAQELTSG